MSMKVKIIKIVAIAVLVLGSAQAQAQAVEKAPKKTMSKAVRKIVKRKVEHRLFREKLNIIKNMIYGEKGQAEKQPTVLYKVPHWPFYTQFYLQRDLFQTDLQAGGASDLATLALGKKGIVVQDVLLASKLAQQGAIQTMGTASVADLALFKAIADQPLIFNASMWQVAGLFNFGRHFKRGRLSFNVQFPLLVRQNNLRLTNDYTDSIQAQVSAQVNSRFSTMSLHDLFDTILQANDLSTSPRATQSGLGDVVTSLYYDIPTKGLERFIVGLKLVLPTSPIPSTDVLWDAEIGNGGFAQIGAFISLLHHRNRWVNIHFHGAVTGSVGGDQNRRVPMRFMNDGTALCTGCNPLSDLVLNNNFMLVPGQLFNELETGIRGLGTEVRSFHISPGVEGLLQIGNMFERCFAQRGFLDIFYGLRIKGSDHIGCVGLNEQFDPSVWGNYTDVVEHKIGGDWSYQFNNQTRFTLGLSYVFAGHNVAKVVEGHVSFRLEF